MCIVPGTMLSFPVVELLGEMVPCSIHCSILIGVHVIVPGTMLSFPVVDLLEEVVPCSIHCVHIYRCTCV